jgi:hypothetical protein
MRKLKLFLSMLMLIAFSVGNVWGAIDANSTWTATAFGDLPDGATVIMINNFGNSFANATVTKAPAKVAASFNSTTKKITVSTEGKSLDDIAWTVEKATNGTKFWVCGSTTNILGLSKTNDNNAVSVNVTTTAQYNEFVLDGGLLKYYDASRYVGEYVNGSDWRSYTSATANNYKSGSTTQSLTFYVLDEGEETACATPTFSPAAGAVVSGTQVSISCSTEGAAIHYTTDGTDPTASSATYSATIPVTSEMTIKAIAVKAGLDNSSVASAAYTVLTPLTTMDQIFAAAGTAGTTPTQVAITFNNWVVTGVKNSNAYVTDGTKGFIVYTSSHGFQVGDILSGTAVCKVQLYNGSAELTELTASKVTVNTGGSVSPVVLDAEGIAALTGANTGSVIKISGACTYESSKYYIADVQLYNQLYSFSVSAGTNYECTGVYVLNTTYGNEILPRSAADIVAQTSVANPTFSPVAGEYTEVQNVTLSCATDGATVYYTTDGTNPTNESTVYSSAIEVGASMTIKAIAYKGEDHSEVVSAAYTINIPLPSHDFQVTHHFSTGEGFEFPTGWGGSYAEHEIAYTDDKVHFASASKQSGTITDRPVVKEGAVSLILTNSSKLISAVRFDYSQWSDKVPTFTMKYSTDGGETYNNFDPVVSSTDFALQVLDLPENVNAIQVVGTANKQTGLTSIAFDLEDKVVVTKTVTITTPTNGTLTVMNGEDAVSSGDAVEVNTVLTITATPAEGYKLTEVTVNGIAYAESTLTLTENVTIAASFEENLADPVNSYVLSVIGVETPQSVSGLKVGDKVNLPSTATACSKTFVGWSENASCAVAPEYAPGAEYTLALNNKLYAVYADANIVTPTDHALGSLTVGGTSGNTASEGYTYTSNKTNDKAGYTQDSGTKDADIVHLQIKAESQIISEEPSAIIVTAHLGAGADRETLTYPVNAVLVDADGNNVGDPVVLTNSIPDKNGDDFSANLPTANYANVRGVKISHMKEDGWNIRYYSMSFKYQTGGTTYDNYSTDCQAQVATPVISGVTADGVYTEGKEISITCATDGATIYYAVDSDEEPNTEYTDAFTVGTAGAHTVKAKAVKTGMAASEIASVSFTINLPLSTMDQIFAAATAAGSTATDANITFGNWVVSGVSTNGKNVYVTDGTKGFIIFDNGGEMGFAVGDVLSGTVACKVQLYKGAAELTTLSSTTEGLNIAKEGVITPAVKAINALSGINTGAAVTINSVQFDGTNLSDGANEIKPYNSLFAYDALENGKYYNVIGIYQQFDATKEILPRSAADIQEVDLDDPELSYSPASATIELGQSLPGTTFANPHELAISYSSNNEAVATVTDAGVISLAGGLGTAVITASFAGNATYAAANVTYTITVNPASVSENVVVLAEHNSKFYAMSTTIASETAVAIEVEYDGTTVTVAKDADKDAIQWTKKTIGENITFQTKDEDKLYLKGTSGGATLSLNATACNWAWDGTNNCYVTGTRGFIYRISTNGFKNYGVSNLSNADYVAPQVIVIAAENIVVTSKADAELAYTSSEVTLTVGSAFTPAVLNYAEGFDGLAAVTYASNNEDVATVDESGVVSLVTDAIGTATITATFAGNNNYLAGSASYTITVNEAGDDLSGTWVLASSVAAGDKIIIMGANNADIYTMGKQNPNNRAAVVSTLSEDVLNPGAATKVFTLVDAGGGKFAIQASNGNYLTSATSGTSNNLLEAADYELDNAKWTITIENGSYSIVAAAGSKTVMQYNSGSTIFSCYGSASQKPVKIFKRDAAPEPAYTTVRSGLECGRHYTVCLENNVTAVKGATFWSLTFKNNEGTVAYLVQENAPFAAGTPYIIQATGDNEGKLEVVYGEEVALSAGTSGALVGTFEDLDADDLNGISGTVYMLFNNELRPIGTYNHLDAHRAYVRYDLLQPVNAAPQIPGKKVKRMPMQGQTTTGCELINAAEAPAKMMINGQLFILRGEKVYDATGRLVK